MTTPSSALETMLTEVRGHIAQARRTLIVHPSRETEVRDAVAAANLASIITVRVNNGVPNPAIIYVVAPSSIDTIMRLNFLQSEGGPA